jgi:site-specific DNA-methyltransferase (adenine-specific)
MRRLIGEGVTVDMVLCDLPYGTTICPWDTVIPFDELWKCYNAIIKDNGAIALFGIEPFSSRLRVSNIKNYRYDWVWRKNTSVGFANAKRRPLRNIEYISVFYKKQPTYNPQGLIKCDRVMRNPDTARRITTLAGGEGFKSKTFVQEYTNYPRQILSFPVERGGGHPTQKPVGLCEYLIRTYTNEGELVLDNCMGSGTTGIACKNLNRDFLGIELDEKYFEMAKTRIGK